MTEVTREQQPQDGPDTAEQRVAAGTSVVDDDLVAMLRERAVAGLRASVA